MNSLSWLIYFAGVSGNVSGLFLAGSIAVFCIVALVNFMRFLVAADDYKGTSPFVAFVPIKTLILGSALALAAAITPNKDTVLMIAASEAAEVVVTDARTQQLFDRVVNSIEEQLDETLKSK